MSTIRTITMDIRSITLQVSKQSLLHIFAWTLFEWLKEPFDTCCTDNYYIRLSTKTPHTKCDKLPLFQKNFLTPFLYFSITNMPAWPKIKQQHHKFLSLINLWNTFLNPVNNWAFSENQSRVRSVGKDDNTTRFRERRRRERLGVLASAATERLSWERSEWVSEQV